MDVRCLLLMLPLGIMALATAGHGLETGPNKGGDREPGFLKPGVGGIHHLALIYAGAPRRVPWDAEKLLPYVAYVDRDGKPRDWLFDSFLWIEFAAPDGTYLHVPVKGKRPAALRDWEWLLHAFFDPGHGVAQLGAAVRLAEETLGPRREPANLVITLPTPYAASTEFGTVEGRALDFRRDADRLAALQWYIREALARWRRVDAGRVRLAGFYWLDEAIRSEDRELVRQTAAFVHSLGLKLYWIPYRGGSGLSEWRELGIDAAIQQPNYYFRQEPTPRGLAAATRRAMIAGAGVEMEVDGRAATDADLRRRYLAYLDAGVKYGFMRDTVLGYYEGGGALREFARSPNAAARELYDLTCQFVKGTYTPRGDTPLPDLPPLVRDTRGNLALASLGARVTGSFYVGPGLEPERLIDGDTLNYGGNEGFAAFVWPGSFTVELPRVAPVSRVETLLFDLDDRHFRYRIEVSEDGKEWRQVVDKSEGGYHGWQSDRFAPTPARFVRFTGLHNTVNTLFQVVEIEVYGGM